MGQRGKGASHGVWEGCGMGVARMGSVVDEPESSTGIEGHDVHGMDNPAVAVW